MIRHKFDQIIDRYLKRQSTPEENKLLDNWADTHFEKHNANSVFTNEQELEETRLRLWNQITSDAGIEPKQKPRQKSLIIRLAVAASLIFAVGLSYLFMDQPTMKQVVSVPVAITATGAETKNSTPTPQRMTLPDGSTVLLENGASLIVDENYGDHKRTVYLKGKAFFDVASDASKPFLVYTGDLITEVLGTSFSISADPENAKTIKVEVKTGKVSVYTSNEEVEKRKNGVIATANQQVTYDTELKTLRHELADEPIIVTTDEIKPDFFYKESSLNTIIKLMKQVYKVDIIVSNPLLNDCQFTGDLNGLDMYRQLDFICEAIGANYEVRGAVVFVYGESCQGN